MLSTQEVKRASSYRWKPSITINFNEGPVQMSFGLESLKYLFPNYENSHTVVEIRNVLKPSADKGNFDALDEFIRSRIEVSPDGSKLDEAYERSNRRLAKRIN